MKFAQPAVASRLVGVVSPACIRYNQALNAMVITMQTQPASAHTVTRGVRNSGKLTDVLYVQCDAINYGAYPTVPTTGHLITNRTELVILVTAESDLDLYAVLFIITVVISVL